MLDDAVGDWCGGFRGVADEAADAVGAVDAAPLVGVGIEADEQVAAEQRGDAVGTFVAAFDAKGEVGFDAFAAEIVEGGVFALRMGPDAVPTRAARHAEAGDAALAVVLGA